MQIALPIPDAVLKELEERLRALVREEIERVTTISAWLDVNDVAEYASMTQEAVRSATKRGQLKCHRSTTGRVRYRAADVDAFLRGEST